LVRCWADEIDGGSIRALIVDPGPTRTALRHQAFPGEDKDWLADPAAIGAMVLGLLTAVGDPGTAARTLTFRDWAPAAAVVAPETL
jgi:NAD(P)-dependent dehydrogenase (short-subunit alcohol dehydrogenase family)